MNKLSKLAGPDGETLLISPPRKKLLAAAGAALGVEFMLLVLTVNYLFAIITTPAIIVWAYVYYEFCAVWVSYKYSRFWLAAAPILSAALAAASRALIF